MNPARPTLMRLPTLCALAVVLWLPGAVAQTAPVAPKPQPPAGAARPAPVVNAPQKPNAQRPPAALPTPPVPPNEVPAAPAHPPAGETATEPAKGSSTGAPLPRFAALRSDEVNFRVGPGTRYPIDWTYKRKDLPILIERELDVWRLVRDPEGTRGWVHVATLTTRRSFFVTGEERTLRRSASEDARAVARLQAGVIGHIRSCKEGAEWCYLQVGDYRGWLKRSEFWGTLPNERVN